MTTATTATATTTATAVVTGIGIVTRETLDPAGEKEGDAWFTARAVLGRGYKYLPRSSQYLIAATRRALADAGTDFDAIPDSERAITVGTNNGTSAMQGEFDRTVIEHRSDVLSPPSVPYFSVNLVGSRVAMEHQLKGFSLGVHSPRVAGLEALQHGQRALAARRARWLLTGAAESPLSPDEPGVASGEDGAVALVVEPAADAAERGATGYGRVRVRSFLLPRAQAARADGLDLARRPVEAALAGLGLGLRDRRRHPVRLVAEDCVVADRVSRLLGPSVTRVPAASGCLGPVLEVADLLTSGAGEHLVVSVAEQGNVSIAYVAPAR
ncbi:3-oxoacyl-ACP synthase [Streptomyces sp. LX-29]|uniref:beta-ketoacyl synthase N-terminal-like domain-containing protein n=1 Tax=Streptomyces sp. LX-29 TaxID=2900152 RepID=UPI00240DB8C8|nr:beta-ketoacyl synthase N-terminal-like domain-containing protein [Streptomyces sp. LX-29]WFB08814.1 3-oxoacyl-ACP synthase [Streptomyces sp. LX-29]